MIRLNESEKEQMNKLIRENTSINNISKIINKSKSTIYYYYIKIKDKKFAKVKFNYSDEDLGEFLGIFVGDGGFYFDKFRYKYIIRVYTGLLDKNYNDDLIKFFSKIFGKKPHNYIRFKDNVCILSYHSKDIYLLLKRYLDWNGIKTYSINIKEPHKHSKDFYIGFLRGLFDTDGNFYKPKKRVSYGTVSSKLAFQVNEIMNKLGFYPTSYINKKEHFYTLNLHGTPAMDFLGFVRPRNIKKIHGFGLSARHELPSKIIGWKSL